MGAIWGSVIPGAHLKLTTAADRDLNDLKPGGAKFPVGIRINDVTSGGSIVLRMAGSEVAYDNCSEGEVLIGRWDKIEATGSNVDSVIVLYA
jgi:hypothetical protein